MKKTILKPFVWITVLISFFVITMVWTMQSPLKDSGRIQRGSYNSTEILHRLSGELVVLTLNIETKDTAFSLWIDNFLADEGRYRDVENTRYNFSGEICTFIIDDFEIDSFSVSLQSLNDGNHIEFMKFSDGLVFFPHTYLTDDELALKSEEAREYLVK